VEGKRVIVLHCMVMPVSADGLGIVFGCLAIKLTMRSGEKVT